MTDSPWTVWVELRALVLCWVPRPLETGSMAGTGERRPLGLEAAGLGGRVEAACQGGALCGLARGGPGASPGATHRATEGPGGSSPTRGPSVQPQSAGTPTSHTCSAGLGDLGLEDHCATVRPAEVHFTKAFP